MGVATDVDEVPRGSIGHIFETDERAFLTQFLYCGFETTLNALSGLSKLEEVRRK